MITRIREVRRAKRLTLADVAERCVPPTTPQTIGRLETGTRTVSVGWLNRIARALEVEAADLVELPETADLPVVAVLAAAGAAAPRRTQVAAPPRPAAGDLALRVEADHGDYRAGDVVWLARIAPDGFADAVGRDALVPAAAGRFLFGRVTAAAPDAVELLAVARTGTTAQRVAEPAWLALATRLVRPLA